jgi:hypothetical protein
MLRISYSGSNFVREFLGVEDQFDLGSEKEGIKIKTAYIIIINTALLLPGQSFPFSSTVTF